MWTCKKCQERLEDSFETCWNCGTSRSGVEDPGFVAEAASAAQERPARSRVDCLRCHRELDYVGTKDFHEGARWGLFGDLAEVFVRKESFDVYVCSNCGHVEFFVTGSRGHPPLDSIASVRRVD
jgi:hypothetical protein